MAGNLINRMTETGSAGKGALLQGTFTSAQTTPATIYADDRNMIIASTRNTKLPVHNGN